MERDAPGHHTTHLDIKNPYSKHDAGCMDYDAPGHQSTQPDTKYSPIQKPGLCFTRPNNLCISHFL